MSKISTMSQIGAFDDRRSSRSLIMLKTATGAKPNKNRSSMLLPSIEQPRGKRIMGKNDINQIHNTITGSTQTFDKVLASANAHSSLAKGVRHSL